MSSPPPVHLGAGGPRTHALTLFVIGGTPVAERARANLARICAEHLNGCDGAAFALTVVDVLEQPDLAERFRVLATPTLIRTDPPPVRRIIGDLADVRKVLFVLDLEGAAAVATTRQPDASPSAAPPPPPSSASAATPRPAHPRQPDAPQSYPRPAS